MSTKVIIVGKNSYIGIHLINYLRVFNWEVVALSSNDCNFLNLSEVNALFSTLINQSVVIIFLAVIKKDHTNDYQTFIENTSLVNNLTKANSKNVVKSIIYLSSVDVYGSRPILPIIEETTVDPDSWYAMGKFACECILSIAGSTNCPTSILRIPGVFGKSLDSNSVVGRMISNARLNGYIHINGNGTVQRDYVYIDDLCALIELLIEKKYHGVLNVATGKSQTILDIANRVRIAFSLDSKAIIHLAGDARNFDLAFDNSRLISVFSEFRFKELPDAIQACL
jgi:nucleoside-diphosphate-sugar epimerase